MKQYKIIVLDCRISDVSGSEIKDKEAMEKELSKYTPIDENDADIYTFDSDSSIDNVLDNFLWKYTDGGCDGDYTNKSLPVAVFCDNEFLGFFLLSQEIEMRVCNTKL